MSEPIFIKAVPGPKNTVIYTDLNGREFEYSRGTRPWRNTNPGDISPGKISKRNGEIGVAGGFSVFPDYKHGHAAHIDCLKTTYANAKLVTLIEKYAPKESNNTKRYLKFLIKKTDISKDKKTKDLTANEFDKLWRAMELMEGWGDNKKGKIREIIKKLKIIKVKKDSKGVIISYFIETVGWISKKDGIALTQKGKKNNFKTLKLK